MILFKLKSNNQKNFFSSLTRPRSRNYQGEPFEAITSTAVDLFPHTPHYELFVLFQR